MYGLLGLDNIWLRYNYLNIWNLRVQKNCFKKMEKTAFKVVQMKFLAMHTIINQKLSFDIFIYGRKFTKYLHGTFFFTHLLNILMIFWHTK